MRFLRDNGLTLALVGIFLFCFSGMAWSGWLAENTDLALHGQAPMGILPYLASPDFQSALFENWESEFLQMSAYVILTALLFQRGSAESRDPDGDDGEEGIGARGEDGGDAPSPLKRGGIVASLYSYSLGIVLVGLFALSFVLHWLASVAMANQDAAMHGEAPQSAVAYLGDPQLWFESLQNWQSEFLATAVLVVLSIFLRFRGSPESKQVSAPHSRTGR